MGCGCGGSNRADAREQLKARREASGQRQAPVRPERSLSDPGYYWTGPKRSKAKA